MNDDSAINRNIWIVSDTHFGHANILNFTDSNTGAKVRTFHDMYDLQNHFQKIMMWRMWPEFDCVLSHVPLHESSMYKVTYNLHGHIHQNASPTPRHYNCSVEVQDYTPRNIEDIMKEIKNV